jgi:ABC-2 type transporter.
MINIIKRNLLVYFRDKSSVFFSLLAVFIIIGLYALFLGDVWVNSMGDIPGARFLMDSWIVSGLLAVTSVTTTMGAFGIMIEDRVNKIDYDFLSSPIDRRALAGGYIVSSFVIGMIMSVVTLVLSEVYIIANGGSLPGIITLLKIFGLILLSVFANTALVLFIVSFFKSLNAFATASTIIGTVIGFLTGIYLPIGQLPESVQFIVKIFPVSHAASLIRQVLMEAPLAASFNGAPDSSIEEFKLLMGVEFKFGDTVVTTGMSFAILIATAIIFYILSIWNISRKKI